MQPSPLAILLLLSLRGIPHWIVENFPPLFPLNVFSDLGKKSSEKKMTLIF